MGKSSNNGAALKEQKKANAQAQKNFEEQMRMMRKAQKQAAAVPIPAAEPIPLPPTESSQDAVAAKRETRLQARRRYGFSQSVSANNPTLGSATAL